MEKTMSPPTDSLLKYSNPVLISKSTDRKSNKVLPLRACPQQPIDACPVQSLPKLKSTSTEATGQENKAMLENIFPNRIWMEENQKWLQQVSSTPSTRADVILLEEMLNTKILQRQARETCICPIRRDLYDQCFDELIRQVTINCAERGLLLLRVRDEIKMTIAAYKTLYESSVKFSIRKALQTEQNKADTEKRISDQKKEIQDLKMQLNEEKAKCDEIEKKENEKRQVEEKKHTEEIQFLKKTIQQLRTQVEVIATPKKS
ncbi:axonemal dynein light intermediate polypeptide 1-like isoform X2 [Paralichthys olivaceus]|uniref:axonemal dynein light intermediate polypeptide 1-like isoform X2 n=1 Tax=Paralichthys olivaceus TaxID=8255 RepID=UPI003750F89C